MSPSAFDSVRRHFGMKVKDGTKNLSEDPKTSKSPDFDFCSTTAIDEEIFTHRWVLKSFKNVWLNLKEGDKLITPEFQGLSKGHKWYVLLKKYKEKHVEYLAVYLCLASRENKNEDAKVMAKVNFCVLGKNNQQVRKLETDVHDFVSGGSSWGYHTYLKAEDLLAAAKDFVVGDQLTIDCRITVLKDLDTYMACSNKIKTTDSLMRETYRKLLESADFYDVLITSATKQHKAHKAILSARSPVFAAMLRIGMTESIEGRINISGFPDHIVKEMLQFLYCGEIENEKENTLELMKIADKYDIKDLFDECCRTIPGILTCDNAVEMLLGIPKNNPADLKSKVMKFIVLNKTAVKKTAAFQQMMHINPELFKEVVLTLL